MLEIRGGRLCLDFANTVHRRPTDSPVERLTSYADLVAWSRQAGVLTDVLARRLLEDAAHQPARAAAVLERAITLRETVYSICVAIAGRRSPEAADLAILNSALGEVLARLRIVSTADGLRWEWHNDEGALDRMLWPVIRSAADLFASSELALVRKCAAQRCGWLFMDTTKNRSRRWCDMRGCGNRAKARRHYERKKMAGELSKDPVRPRQDGGDP